MLTYAIVSGKYQSVRKLIELGANINKSDRHGYGPMTWAAIMLCEENEDSDKIFNYVQAICLQQTLRSPRNSPKASSFVARINDEQKESSYSRDL